MKRIFFCNIIVTGLILTSCSTSKKAHDTLHVATEATEQADLHAESRQTTESTSHTATESTTAESEDVRRIELEFDTTQPADSDTRLPPVKCITITDRRRNRQTNTGQQTSDTLTKQTEVTIQDSTRQESQTETISEQDIQKKSRPSHLPWLLVGIVFVALGWAAWKKWRR